MSLSNNLENFVATVVERCLSGRNSERHALVTSYDPKTYLAKVKFQPYGQLSGWMPIESGHIGSTYGITAGLQPGSGGGDSSGGGGGNGGSGGADGDQVIVRFQENDFEVGKIVQRLHSKKDTPPPTQSGEMILYTKFKKDKDPGPDAAKDGQEGSTGQKIWFKNDGSISTEDGNGASRVMDGKGNYTVTSGNAQQGTTSIVHQVLQDKPASSNDSGADSVGSMLAGGSIASMMGGLLHGSGSTTPSDITDVLMPLINSNTGATGVSPATTSSGSGGNPISMLSGLLSGGGGGMMGGLSGLMGNGGMSGLTSMMGGAMQQVLHYSKLDKKKGIKTAAFQEKHWTTWDQSGVTHSSQKNVASIAQQNVTMQAQNQVVSQAPQIPHLGNSSVSQVLTVGIQTNSPIYTNASDARIKENIRQLNPTLTRIMLLRPCAFDEHRLVIDENSHRYDPTQTTPMIGFVAQEVRRFFPEVVYGDEAKEMLCVAEGKINVLLLKAFQEFVEEMRAEIAELKRTRQ